MEEHLLIHIVNQANKRLNERIPIFSKVHGVVLPQELGEYRYVMLKNSPVVSRLRNPMFHGLNILLTAGVAVIELIESMSA